MSKSDGKRESNKSAIVGQITSRVNIENDNYV